MRLPFLLTFGFSLAITASTEAQPIRYTQDFDAVTAPVLPRGWTSPDDAWTTSTSVPSPGSGGNNVENRGNSPGSLQTPEFDFSAVSTGTIRYTIRRTATYDSLNIQVEASIDGGTNWDVVLLDSIASVPAPPSTYVTVESAISPEVAGESRVMFRWRAMRSTGGNVRIDDFEILADGPLAFNRFGFAATGSAIVDGTGNVAIPLGIELIPTSGGMQGLQFVLSHTTGLAVLSVQAGIPAIEGPEWHLTHEADGSLVRVILLAEGTAGLEALATDSLLLVQLEVTPLGVETGRMDSLTISEVVASSPSDSGLDLSLAVERPLYILSVQSVAATLVVDSASVDFGTIELNSSAEAVLSLSNPGTGPLEITDMFSISGLLGIDPAFLTIDPGASANLTLTAEGASYGVGPLEDWLIIDYNGPDSPDTLAITGHVVDAEVRGDANDDGAVDVVDLVLGIDHILGRVSLPATASRLDLHPFPDGNEVVDVRDLTVIAQAIARGQWPDAMPLPEAPQPAGKDGSIVGDLIVRRDEQSTSIWIRSAEPLRAVHVVGHLSEPDASITVDGDLPAVHVGRPYRGSGNQSFSLLTYGLDALPVTAGQTVLLATIDAASGIEVSPEYTIAVDNATNRRTLVTVRETTEHPDDAPDLQFDDPYPNPVSPRRSALVHLPMSVADQRTVRLVVRDVLGRVVRTFDLSLDRGTRVAVWDLRNQEGFVVPAGLYFLSVEFNGSRQTRTVVIN